MSDLAEMLAANKPGAQWALSGTTLAGLTWLDGVQTAPVQADLDAWIVGKARRELIGHAQSKRTAVVNGGCVVGGIPIWTDSESQAALTGAVVASQVVGPSFTTKWKGRDGNFYPMTASTIVQLAMGAMTFVATAFGVESSLKDAITAGTITTTAEIDKSPWPSNGLGK